MVFRASAHTVPSDPVTTAMSATSVSGYLVDPGMAVQVHPDVAVALRLRCDTAASDSSRASTVPSARTNGRTLSLEFMMTWSVRK